MIPVLKDSLGWPSFVVVDAVGSLPYHKGSCEDCHSFLQQSAEWCRYPWLVRGQLDNLCGRGG